MVLPKLTPEQIQSYKDNGFLLLRANQIWSEKEAKDFLSFVNELDAWPETPGKWMKYFEKSLIDQSRILQRIENFFFYHKGLDDMFNGKHFLHLLENLMGEEAVLFKEKINYKLPGGGEFKPHQDAQAGWGQYGHTYHISVLVTVDASDMENGCLEVVKGKHKNGLLGPEWSELTDEVVNSLEWDPVPTQPGDILFFDSYVPHRSGPNLSSRPRRALYVTYNKKSEGEARVQYWSDKRKNYPPDIERETGKVYVYKI